MASKTKSITGCTGAFVYTDGKFTEVYPKHVHTQTLATETLSDFCQDVGIPEKLKTDKAPEFSGANSEFFQFAKK